MLPEVIMHSKSQDEEQVRDHYDREWPWFTSCEINVLRCIQGVMISTPGSLVLV